MPDRDFFQLTAVCLAALLTWTACGGGASGGADDPCDGQCLSNQVCDQGQCVACTANAHCTSAAAPVCRLADNICVECTQSSQCGSKEICKNAQCIVPEEAGCSGDADCAGDDVCVAGTCQVCQLGTCNAAGDARCQSATIGGTTSWARCDSGRCEQGLCLSEVGIQAVREAAKAAGNTAAAIDIAIENAVVTYVRQKIGDDEAGFFLQEGPTGPAIFVNASAGSASPRAGDMISLRATRVVVDEVSRITAYTDYTKKESNVSLGGYAQDISDKSDIKNNEIYESEWLEGIVTLTGAFGSIGSAGMGFEKAPIRTDGYAPAQPSREFVLRIPEALATTIEQEASALQKSVIGCHLLFNNGFYWGYVTETRSDTQITLYDRNELFDVDCADAEDLSEIPTNWDYIETFDSISTQDNDYTKEHSYSAAGISWNIVGRTQMTDRETDYSIDGQGVILKKAGAITASGLTKGIDYIAFDHRMWSKSAVATIEFFDSAEKLVKSISTETLSNTTRQTFAAKVDAATAVRFKITVSSDNRLIVDNVRWTNAK